MIRSGTLLDRKGIRVWEWHSIVELRLVCWSMISLMQEASRTLTSGAKISLSRPTLKTRITFLSSFSETKQIRLQRERYETIIKSYIDSHETSGRVATEE
jgi:hypothetical protein